jgi:trans-aconitate 2-methyltransferase
MAWDPAQYLKFEDERTRPVEDLLRAIPTDPVEVAMDVGCGPGNSTAALGRRFPGARLYGLDSSEAMIAAARAREPEARFEVASLETWRASSRFDVILANAVLHWVPDHARLLPSLIERLNPGGSLAAQIPDNPSQPSHQALHKLASSKRWSDRLNPDMAKRTPIREPEWYLELLQPRCAHLNIWRTTYYHRISGGIDGVVEWFKGSALRPFLEALSPDERASFLDEYRDELREAYATVADGAVLLPFPRFFMVAVR